MRLLKGILKVIGGLIVVIMMIAAIAIILDESKTSYLDIDGNRGFGQNSYLIKNVHIVPMSSDTILYDHMLLVEDGIISQIDTDIPVSDHEVIDGKGAFLMPGLTDMHVHVWDNYELGLYLANGVTTVRNLWGHPMHLRMKESIRNEEIIGPNFYTTGPKLTGPEFMGDDNLQLFTEEEARSKVIEYKERGYDLIKTYYGLTEVLFDAILEQAEISDIDVVAHPTPKVPYNYHFHPQISTIEHTEDFVQQPLNYELDSNKLVEIINEYVAHPNSAHTPTLVAFYNIYAMLMDDEILSDEQLDYMNPLIRMEDSRAQFDRWNGAKQNDPEVITRIKDQHDFHLLIIRKLHERGVNIVCGTDAGIGITTPGYSIHQELGFYKKAGMTNYEVLKTATVNPSKTHDFLQNQGTIATGKQANLIVLPGNPLHDLENLKDPAMVFVSGRKIDKETLDDFEAQARNRSNLVVTALRYAENLLVEK